MSAEEIGPRDMVLLTDLYELKMVQACWREGLTEEAVFSLHYRSLPASRSFMLSCGLHDALTYLEELRFDEDHLAWLSTVDGLLPEFIRWLREFRFTGGVRALPEGTPVFPHEPLLEVRAPLPEAQLVESYVMNQVHYQTVVASKAIRVVHAAAGRPVVDFGLRRMHGSDAALKGARAFHIAGVAATSNVLAGRIYGIPITGTMAHSYIQAHDDELAAFREFAGFYPATVLLVDTYDTLAGVRKVVALSRELGAAFKVHGVRLDSGDLAELARETRRLLDEAGLRRVQIFASGGLDENSIADLVASGAPIDAFGVGTRMGVSEDAPDLDMAYKLVSYAGRPRLKTSPGKHLLPGSKQVFRVEHAGRATHDVLALQGEDVAGRPLLVPVMAEGKRLPSADPGPSLSRERARREIALLPERLLRNAPPSEPFPVSPSPALVRLDHSVTRELSGDRGSRGSGRRQ